MSLDTSPELAEELRSLGVEIRGSLLPSIRRVRRLTDEDEHSTEMQEQADG